LKGLPDSWEQAMQQDRPQAQVQRRSRVREQQQEFLHHHLLHHHSRSLRLRRTMPTSANKTSRESLFESFVVACRKSPPRLARAGGLPGDVKSAWSGDHLLPAPDKTKDLIFSGTLRDPIYTMGLNFARKQRSIHRIDISGAHRREQ
jgi:hypothetical protein